MDKVTQLLNEEKQLRDHLNSLNIANSFEQCNLAERIWQESGMIEGLGKLTTLTQQLNMDKAMVSSITKLVDSMVTPLQHSLAEEAYKWSEHTKLIAMANSISQKIMPTYNYLVNDFCTEGCISGLTQMTATIAELSVNMPVISKTLVDAVADFDIGRLAINESNLTIEFDGVEHSSCDIENGIQKCIKTIKSMDPLGVIDQFVEKYNKEVYLMFLFVISFVLTKMGMDNTNINQETIDAFFNNFGHTFEICEIVKCIYGKNITYLE